MPHKLVIPAVLGLSLVSVTAVVLYYVFKKEDDDEEKTTVKTSRLNTIEINVPKSILPALIGRSGSNIKEFEKKSGAKINFRAFSDKDYDVCVIHGGGHATQLAEMLVHDFMKQQPLIEEEIMEVPAWACGRIIGTGGENINDISHRSGARVKIEGTGDKNSQRCVRIKGTKQQIEVAKGLVEVSVAQEKCRREIEQSKRSPRYQSNTSLGSPVTSEQSDDLPESGGAPIEVYVSAVSSPSRFWVQFVGPQVAQLDDLVAQMTEYYGNKDNREAHALSQLSVGQVVAAVFRHDGRWYRARVHDIRANEFDATQQVADVFYVDYGDSEYVATHELCELRADLLRLRFQAMECFLAGVQPPDGQQRWGAPAVERFEELVQVARWKSLVSRTCTYKKTITAEGEKEREIPGIKLFDVTDEGELDIGAALVSEGLAQAAPLRPKPQPAVPFGDLGSSRVLGMFGPSGPRASSLPKDHNQNDDAKDNERLLSSSQSHASGLEMADKINSVSNFDLPYPHNQFRPVTQTQEFINHEAQNGEGNTSQPHTPVLGRSQLDDLKANINRIDSHHGNLDALAIDKNEHNL